VGDFVKQIKDEYKKINTPIKLDAPDSLSSPDEGGEEEWVVV